MAERILIRFSADQFEWLVVNTKGKPLSGVGRGSGEELANLCRRKQVVLLAPGADVLLTQVTLPTRNTAGIMRALPYAVEEQLAEDVDALHFARGSQDSEGTMAVAVIRRQCLDTYLETLSQLGIQPAKVYAAPLLLPREDNTWSILLENDRALLRYGDSQGMELETDCLAPILGRLLQEQDAENPPKLKVWYSGDLEPDTGQLAMTGCEIDVVPVPETGMALMASTLAKHTPLDLLQGEYRQQGASLFSFKPWRPALVLLVLAMLVQLAGMGYQHWLLKAEAQALEEEIETLFRSAFPDAGRLVPGRERVLAQQKLAELRRQYGQGVDTFLSLLHSSGEELHKERSLRLIGLNFKNRILQLNLKGKDLSQFEELKEKLLQGGGGNIDVKVLSAVARKDSVDGRIMIQERK